MWLLIKGIEEIQRKAADFVQRGINLIYPEVCPVCMEIFNTGSGDAGICENCRKKLKYIQTPRCLKCGKQIGSEEKQYCYDCAKRQHVFAQGVGVWSYTEDISRSIYAFKYDNQRHFAKIYAKELYSRCGNIINKWNAEVLIPVPLHADRMRMRGYNQALLIAKEFGRLANLPTDDEILIRERKTKPQKELNDKERVKNLENAFKISKSIVEYKRVILVDDIYTTGTTMDACAKILKDKGAEEVYFAALCIGRGF